MSIALAVWVLGHLYVFARAWTVLRPAGRAPRAAFLAVALLLSGSFFAARWLEDALPAAVVVPLEVLGFEWMAVWMWCVFGLLVVDVATVAGFAFRGRVRALRGGAFAVAGAVAVIASVQALRAPVVREHEVRLAGLPREAEGTVLVAVSDLHLGTMVGRRWLDARVRQVEQLRPDVVVVLGDVLEGDSPSESRFLPGLRALSAPLGVWAVNGNHERYGRQAGSTGGLEDAGFRVLLNRWEEVRPGLVLAGVEDLTRHGRGRMVAADPVGEALAGRPEGAATVMLSHSPLQAERVARGGAGLMLAGHTHDGQIWPFGYTTRLFYPLMAGRYDVDGMPVVVCRGTGTWGPRMRLWRRSEMLRIILRAA